MPEIVTDYAVTYPWKAYKNGGNTFTIALTLNSAPFDISDYVFTLNVRTPFGEVNRLQLTEGSGITNGGTSGVITITLTQTQASITLSRDYYFWELSYVFNSVTYRMFSGGLTLSEDVNTSTTVALARTISLAGTQINVNIATPSFTADMIADALGLSNLDDDGQIVASTPTSDVKETVYLASAHKARVEADGGTFEALDCLESFLRKLQNIDI